MSEEINSRLDRIDRVMQQLHTLHDEIRRHASGHPEPHFIGPSDEIDHSIDPSWDLQVVFSERVSGFEEADVVVLNGDAVLADQGNGYDYVLTVTPESGYTGDYWVTVPAGSAHDSQGNVNVAGHFHVPIV